MGLLGHPTSIGVVVVAVGVAVIVVGVFLIGDVTSAERVGDVVPLFGASHGVTKKERDGLGLNHR